PGLAEIAGLENVGLEIVELVSVDGGIGSARFERRRLNQADHGPFRKTFGSDLAPGFSIVTRELNQAIVGADPDQTFLFRRLGNGKNQIVELNAGLIFCNGASGILLFRWVIASEVRADGFPGMAAILRTKEKLRRVIKNVRIVRRENDGHRPGVAIFLDGGVVAVGI